MRLRVVSRLRLAVFLVVLSLVLVMGGFIAGARAFDGCDVACGEAGPLRVEPVVVTPGDTLWEIASAYAPPSMDRRLAVFVLREHNSLDTANLCVGQRIAIPAAWPR